MEIASESELPEQLVGTNYFLVPRLVSAEATTHRKP